MRVKQLFIDSIRLLSKKRNILLFIAIAIYTLFNIYILRLLYNSVDDGFNKMLAHDCYAFTVGLISFGFLYVILPEHKSGFIKRLFISSKSRHFILFKRLILIFLLGIVSVCILALNITVLKLTDTVIFDVPVFVFFKFFIGTIFYSLFLLILFSFSKSISITIIGYFIITRVDILLLRVEALSAFMKFSPFQILDKASSFFDLAIALIYFVVLFFVLIFIWKRNKNWDY